MSLDPLLDKLKGTVGETVTDAIRKQFGSNSDDLLGQVQGLFGKHDPKSNRKDEENADREGDQESDGDAEDEKDARDESESEEDDHKAKDENEDNDGR